MTEAAEVLDPQMPPEQPDPRDIARAVAMDVADEPEQVGEVVNAIELDDNVTDFRLSANVRGYEGWQWSVTLYHDAEVGTWTVNESSLVPTEDALVPPAWIPWKDRLEPTDLAPTDSIGTDPDDPRLEGGFRKTEPAKTEPAKDGPAEVESAETEPAESVESAEPAQAGESAESAESNDSADSTDSAEFAAESAESAESTESTEPTDQADSAEEAAKAETQAQEADEIVEEFQLSRRHVLSPQGRAQVAKRWYEGPRGPKAMSTKTADGNLCSTCGFFVPLKGELNRMFGVCANKWSPDDGRVVSLDHGCGEHSEIEPPEPSHLWVQSKPAYDDFHIDVIAQKPRDERGAVEAIEQLDDESQDSDEATEEDILANTEPDTGDDELNETQPAGVEASAELEAVIAIAEGDGEQPGDGTQPGDGEEAEEPEGAGTPEESAEVAESVESAEATETVEDAESAETEETAENASDTTVESGETEESGESAKPGEAEEPAQPEQTEDSAESDEPAEPTDPTDTAESEESDGIEESEESDEQAEQAESAEHEESEEPAESAEPEESEKSEEPAEPAEPIEPAEPTEPGELSE